jgi:hypothetical protein
MQTRFALFIIFCLGIRVTLAYIARQSSPRILRIMGYLAIAPVIGFMYIFLSGSRTTGLEVMGGKIWWNSLRPVHALLYTSFAFSAINSYSYAWMFLLVDVALGIISFIIHHYRANDFA